MQPQMQPASYPSLHGNGPYAAQPMSAPYSAHQPQYGSYGNDIGVGHQQQPGVMLGNPGAIQQNTDHNIASQYGYGHSSGALHDGQHVPHALGPGTMPVDPRVLPSNQAIGVGVTASVPAMVGGASGLQPPMGTSQMTGQGLGISEGFPCVRLRGLPFESTEQDVEGWLVGSGSPVR